MDIAAATGTVVAITMDKRKEVDKLSLLWAIIVILAILWLVGWLGPTYYSGIPRTGNTVHLLAVIALVLIILALLGVI